MSRTAERPEDADRPSQEEVDRAVQVAESLRQQLGLYEEQRALLASSHAEAERASRALDGLAGAKPGDVVLVPLGSGTFVRMTVGPSGRVLSAVGSGVHVEGSPDDAKKRLADRAESVKTTLQRLDAEAREVQAEYARIVRGLQALEG